MAIINEYDALTDSNVEIEISAKDLTEMKKGIINTTTADIEAAKKESKSALLERLGITAEEAAILLQ